MIKRTIPLCLIAFILLPGCAYFNTYYNAKKLYYQASQGRVQFPDTAVAGSSQAGLYQKAIEKFSYVIAKYPKSRWAPPSLFYMAESYFRRGEYQKAQGLYQDVWQVYPGSRHADRARLAFSICCWKIGEYERAERILTPLSGQDSKWNEPAGFMSALIKQSSGDISEASLAWEKFVYQHPKSRLLSQALYNWAHCLLQAKNYPQAVAVLQKLHNRRLPKALRLKTKLLLAEALERANDILSALKIYTEAARIAVDPNDLRTIDINVARIQAAQVENDSARAILRQVAQKYPKSEAAAQAFLLIGELWEQENMLDSAQNYYNLARGESPASDFAAQALASASDIAVLQALDRQVADAKSQEQNAAIQFLMAEHYLFQLQQAEPAVERYLQVANSYPQLPIAPKALYAAAWTQFHRGADTVRADSLFRRLIQLYPATRYANAAREYLGLPVDSLANDTEPEIGLAAPLNLPAAKDSLLPRPKPEAPARTTPSEEPQQTKPESPSDEPGAEPWIKE